MRASGNLRAAYFLLSTGGNILSVIEWSHTDERPYSCPHCSYKCSLDSNLKAHIKRHFSKRDHVCEICGAAFHDKQILEEHQLGVHSERRDFHCLECPKTFKLAKALHKHMKVHSGVKEHVCSYCGVAFRHRYNLRRHMRHLHGNDDPLPPIKRVGLLDKKVQPKPVPMMKKRGKKPQVENDKIVELVTPAQPQNTLPMVPGYQLPEMDACMAAQFMPSFTATTDDFYNIGMVQQPVQQGMLMQQVSATPETEEGLVIQHREDPRLHFDSRVFMPMPGYAPAQAQRGFPGQTETEASGDM